MKKEEIIYTWHDTQVIINHTKKVILISEMLKSDRDSSGKIVGGTTFSPSLEIENYEELFIGSFMPGYFKDEDYFYGNTILVNIIDNKYLLIDDGVTLFDFPEKIKYFYGIVGDSAVQYTTAQSENYTLFLPEMSILPNRAILKFDDIPELGNKKLSDKGAECLVDTFMDIIYNNLYNSKYINDSVYLELKWFRDEDDEDVKKFSDKLTKK